MLQNSCATEIPRAETEVHARKIFRFVLTRACASQAAPVTTVKLVSRYVTFLL